MKGKMGRKGRRGCGFVDGSARYVGDSWQRDGCIHCNCIGVSHVLLSTPVLRLLLMAYVRTQVSKKRRQTRKLFMNTPEILN